MRYGVSMKSCARAVRARVVLEPRGSPRAARLAASPAGSRGTRSPGRSCPDAISASRIDDGPDQRHDARCRRGARRRPAARPGSATPGQPASDSRPRSLPSRAGASSSAQRCGVGRVAELRDGRAAAAGRGRPSVFRNCARGLRRSRRRSARAARAIAMRARRQHVVGRRRSPAGSGRGRDGRASSRARAVGRGHRRAAPVASGRRRRMPRRPRAACR